MKMLSLRVDRRAPLRACCGVALLAFAIVAGLSRSARAEDDQLVAAAIKEGKLFIYGDDVHLPPLIAGFARKYPGIRVQFASYGGWGSFQRWLQEKKAGRDVASLIYTGEDALQAGSNDGDFVKYVPPDPGLAKWAVKDDGSYILVHGVILGITYNPSAIGDAPLPKDWMDFATPSPAWQGLVMFADPRASSLSYALVAAFYQDFGPEKAAVIFRGLQSSGVEILPNAGPQTAKMMSGERPLTLTLHSGYLADMLSKGAPVKQIVPASGVNPQFVGMAIPSNAPEPNAAKLFLDYSISMDGQSALVAVGVYGTRADAKPPADMPALDAVKVLPTDIKRAIVDRDKIIAWWQKAAGVD